MMRDLSARKQRELRAIYHLSPILWAVIRGHDTAEKVAAKLRKRQQAIELGIDAGISIGLLVEQGDRLLPAQPNHRSMYHTLNPSREPTTARGSIAVEQLTYEILSTQQVAELLDRPYHSVYKTLQRWQDKGLVQRVDKRWQRL